MDGTLFTHTAIEVPRELLLADESLLYEDEVPDKVPVSLYTLIADEAMEMARTTFVSYRYSHEIEKAPSLVDSWVQKGI